MKYPKGNKTGPGQRRSLKSRGFKIGMRWNKASNRRKKRRR